MWNNTYGTQYYGGQGLPKGASTTVDTSGLNNFFSNIGDNLKRAIFSPDEVNRERAQRLKKGNPGFKPSTNVKTDEAKPKLDPLDARRQVLEQAGIIKPGAPIPDMETENVPIYTEEAGYSYDPAPTSTTELPSEPPAPSVSAQDALKGFLGKLDTKYGITYGSPAAPAAADTNTEMPGIKSERLASALSDTESLRYDPNKGSYEDAGTASDYVLPGLDKGTRAFLDYDGPGGTLMALRSRDAARNTLRAGGRDYKIDGDNATLISRAGSEYLRDNPGADAASEEFMTQFMKEAPTAVAPSARSQYVDTAGATPMVVAGITDDQVPSIDRGDLEPIIADPSAYDLGAKLSVGPAMSSYLPDTQYWDKVRDYTFK